MPLETAVHITDLVIANPAASDPLSQADDHMRMIKSVLQTDIGNALVSKSLAVVDGSSGAPSIGFSADATAGFYRKGTGQIGVVGTLVGTGTVDIGFVGMYAAASVPTGYLACDGQAVSRTTYSALFAAIGTVWGAGDGSTTFNVPGLNSRFPRHREVSGAAGAVGTVQANQNLSHTHTFSATSGTNSADHTHTYSGNTSGMSANDPHNHTSNAPSNAAYTSSGADGGFAFPQAGSTATINTTSIAHTHAFSGTTSGASATHTHSVSGTTATGSADGTEARPQSATLLFCIRAL